MDADAATDIHDLSKLEQEVRYPTRRSDTRIVGFGSVSKSPSSCVVLKGTIIVAVELDIVREAPEFVPTRRLRW